MWCTASPWLQTAFFSFEIFLLLISLLDFELWEYSVCIFLTILGAWHSAWHEELCVEGGSRMQHQVVRQDQADRTLLQRSSCVPSYCSCSVAACAWSFPDLISLPPVSILFSVLSSDLFCLPVMGTLSQTDDSECHSLIFLLQTQQGSVTWRAMPVWSCWVCFLDDGGSWHRSPQIWARLGAVVVSRGLWWHP